MEKDVFRTRRVLEDREDGGHGAANVGDVEGHGHVDGIIGAQVGGCSLFCLAADGGAVRRVVEFRGFFEVLSIVCGGGIEVGRED